MHNKGSVPPALALLPKLLGELRKYGQVLGGHGGPRAQQHLLKVAHRDHGRHHLRGRARSGAAALVPRCSCRVVLHKAQGNPSANTGAV